MRRSGQGSLWEGQVREPCKKGQVREACGLKPSPLPSLAAMGGGAAACAKVGQVKMKTKTYDVAGALGEAGFNRVGSGVEKLCSCVGARADSWVSSIG